MSVAMREGWGSSLAPPSYWKAREVVKAINQVFEEHRAGLSPSEEKVKWIQRSVTLLPPTCFVIMEMENGIPIIRWNEALHPEADGLVSLDQEKISYCTPTLRNELKNVAPRPAFSSEEEMVKAFEHFKTFLSTCVPLHELLDNCEGHTLWMKYTMDHIFKIESSACKVAPQNPKGSLYPSLNLFPDPIVRFCKNRSAWSFHEGLKVRCGKTEYIFDLLLDKPVPLTDWQNGLEATVIGLRGPKLIPCEIREFPCSWAAHPSSEPPSAHSEDFGNHPCLKKPRISHSLLGTLWDRYFQLSDHDGETIEQDSDGE